MLQKSTPVHQKVGVLEYIKEAKLGDSRGDAHDLGLLSVVPEPVPPDNLVAAGKEVHTALVS